VDGRVSCFVLMVAGGFAAAGCGGASSPSLIPPASIGVSGSPAVASIPTGSGSSAGTSAPIGDLCSLLTTDEIKQVTSRTVTSSGPDPALGSGEPSCQWDLAPPYAGAAAGDNVEITAPSGKVLSAAQQIALDRQINPGGQTVRGIGDDAYAFVVDDPSLSIVKGQVYVILRGPNEDGWPAFLEDLGKKVAERL
jgi:hypothetical protein